ncbi:energy transducer TonB [Spirosoma sp. KNUC1025]|uniref:energy transducer TonB n=1 Tax=Spirosoma sp. KNUC1025 TaxID=2894082 RepID=UPI003862D9C5|nr:energy transducer TonB [Spirosoma sp. KNUC1025]
MKRTFLTLASVTLFSALATAQAIDQALVVDSRSDVFAQRAYEQELPLPSPSDFAPLTNEPFFPGGQQALVKYLGKLDLYPDQARMVLSEGTVRVQFRVQPSGTLTDIQVVKSKNAVLDQAAVKAVSLMPRWYPAHRSGVAVSTLVELPVTFRLD